MSKTEPKVDENLQVFVHVMDEHQQQLLVIVARAEGAMIARWNPWGITIECSEELARLILRVAGEIATSFEARCMQALVDVLKANGYTPGSCLENRLVSEFGAEANGLVWEWRVEGLPAGPEGSRIHHPDE